MVCAVMMSMPSMLVRFTPQTRFNSACKSNLGAFPSARDFFRFCFRFADSLMGASACTLVTIT
jgi:hypothetical protein